MAEGRGTPIDTHGSTESNRRDQSNPENAYYVALHSAMTEADTSTQDDGSKRTNKRPDYWSWKQFHMSVSFLSAQRSRDPSTKVGACIVNPQNKIVGIGHNDLPESQGCRIKDFPYWKNRDIEKCGFEETKYAYVLHASLNAILNKNAENLEGCTMYTTLFPGHEDAKMIIQAGITKVVYFEDKYHDYMFAAIARKLFDKAKVQCVRFTDAPVPCRIEELLKVDIYPLPPTSVGNKATAIPEPSEPKEVSQPLSNEDFFMSLACLAARRSKDPSRQVGACIVNKDNQVVGVGYNGFPLRVSDDDPEMNWGKNNNNPMKSKLPYVVHAEVNAIIHKTCIDLKGCTLYTTLFPCNECAKVIVQAGIEVIYYLMDDQSERIYTKASRQLLERAGYVIIPTRWESNDGKPDIKLCQQYVPSNIKIPDIDLKTLPQLSGLL